MKPAKLIGTRTIVIDGEECEVCVLEPALPKPKRKNEANLDRVCVLGTTAIGTSVNGQRVAAAIYRAKPLVGGRDRKNGDRQRE